MVKNNFSLHAFWIIGFVGKNQSRLKLFSTNEKAIWKKQWYEKSHSIISGGKIPTLLCTVAELEDMFRLSKTLGWIAYYPWRFQTFPNIVSSLYRQIKEEGRKEMVMRRMIRILLGKWPLPTLSYFGTNTFSCPHYWDGTMGKVIPIL